MHLSSTELIHDISDQDIGVLDVYILWEKGDIDLIPRVTLTPSISYFIMLNSFRSKSDHICLITTWYADSSLNIYLIMSLQPFATFVTVKPNMLSYVTYVPK